jgi:hypothetical protein
MNKTILCLVALFVSSSAHALISPIYRVMNEFKASFGVNPCIKVVETPTAEGHIQVQACTAEVGEALATILVQNANGGYGSLDVLDPTGKSVKPAEIKSLDQLAALADKVLKDNPFYTKSYPYSIMGGPPSEVLVEFKPKVIQVFVDNISNPYGTNAFVASDLFSKFLNQTVGDLNFRLETVTSPE